MPQKEREAKVAERLDESPWGSVHSDEAYDPFQPDQKITRKVNVPKAELLAFVLAIARNELHQPAATKWLRERITARD